jgi:hypothetical protein
MNAPLWGKSSHSGVDSQTDCVELARLPGGVGVRDSKYRDAGHLSFSRTVFAGVVACVKKSEFCR